MHVVYFYFTRLYPIFGCPGSDVLWCFVLHNQRSLDRKSISFHSCPQLRLSNGWHETQRCDALCGS